MSRDARGLNYKEMLIFQSKFLAIVQLCDTITNLLQVVNILHFLHFHNKMDSPTMSQKFLVLAPTVHAETTFEELTPTTSNNVDLPSPTEKDRSLSVSSVESLSGPSPTLFPNVFLRLGPDTAPQTVSK